MGRGAKIQFHYDMCVLVAYREESWREWLDSGNIFHTQLRIFTSFLEMLVI